MTRRAFAHVFASAIFLVAAEAARLPEARTPEEFDSYIEFHEAMDAEAKHLAAMYFKDAYPDSEMLVYVYQSEMEYARSRNLYQKAVAAGERLLRLAPNDLKGLLGLAEVLPYGTDDPAVLAKAVQHAKRVLDEARALKLPRDSSVEECENLRRYLQSHAHAALGYVAGKLGRREDAITEFETATSLSPEPDGAQLLRLGTLYRDSQREKEAIETFRRAAQAGPADITALAEMELREKRE
jgi:tetratricopeptide (TPR) repeat protein